MRRPVLTIEQERGGEEYARLRILASDNDDRPVSSPILLTRPELEALHRATGLVLSEWRA